MSVRAGVVEAGKEADWKSYNHGIIEHNIFGKAVH